MASSPQESTAAVSRPRVVSTPVPTAYTPRYFLCSCPRRARTAIALLSRPQRCSCRAESTWSFWLAADQQPAHRANLHFSGLPTQQHASLGNRDADRVTKQHAIATKHLQNST